METDKKSEIALNTKGGELVPFDYGDDAGVGMDTTMEDLNIPFIALAQNDSKILDPEEPTYQEGGAAGMLFNGATKEYADQLLLVPAMRRTTYVEWLPDRGGYVDEHDPSSEVVQNAKRNSVKKHELFTESGNELQETRSIFAIIVNEDLEPTGYCIVPFTSSKMAPWRNYWTKIDTARVSKSAPLFSHLVRLSSFDDKNKAGKKYKNFVMLPARDKNGVITNDKNESHVQGSMISNSEAAYIAARELREAVDSGRAKADHATQAGEGKEQDEVF